MLKRLLLSTSFVAISASSACAWPAVPGIYGSSAVSAGCTKPSALDLAGTDTQCHSATQNPSFINASFFGTGAGNARQSGQSAYYYNGTTLNYDIACVDVGCGYDTTQLVNDPADISFSSSSGTVTSGVLTVSDANLGGTSGNIAVGQYIGTGGVAATISSPKTVSLTSHNAGVQVWQLDQNVTVGGTPTITGTRFPQIACFYNSAGPIVQCATTSDTTTATTINGYDMSLHGGVYIDISQGGTGVAGAVTVTNNHFLCNPADGLGGFKTEVGTHFDITFSHNELDGNYPAQSGCNAASGFGAFFANNTTGTDVSHKVNIDFEWNYVHGEAIDAVSGLGDYTNKIIANNAFMGFNLDPGTGTHGAVYADSAKNPRGTYIYKHNICLYPSTAPATLGTTCFSYLANASFYPTATIDDMEALGNIAISNCTSLPCNGSTNYTVGPTLFQVVDPPYAGILVSKGNLVDRTGGLNAPSAAAYNTGGSRNRVTTSGSVAYASPAISVQTVTVMPDNWSPNSFVHVNNTPFTFNGTIVSDHNSSTGTLTLDSPNASLSNAYGVGGALVPPGMCISSKTDNSHFKVKNYYGTTDALLTAPHQPMYTAYTVLDPQQVTDPATGQHPTGTGTNTGTYALAYCGGAGSGGGASTWFRFNITVGTQPPTINQGNDYDIRNGGGLYIGGTNGGSGFAP